MGLIYAVEVRACCLMLKKVQSPKFRPHHGSTLAQDVREEKMYGSGLKEWLEGSLLKYTALERAKTAAPEKVLTAKKAMNTDG